MTEKVKKILKKPSLILVYLGHLGFLRFLPDKQYLKLIYKIKTGKKLNLSNPKTYNEKLQWLKLNDRKKVYATMVDKYEVKKYVSNIIGEEYIIPTLGIYDSFDEIEFDKLPNQFVIKCTHNSGGIVVVKDKKNFDYKKARKLIQKCLKNNFYYGQREWPYKNVKPRVLVEKYVEDNTNQELRDYKFFCFDGNPKLLFVATDRNIHQTKFNFYDINFKRLPIRQHYPNDERNVEKPSKYDIMIKLAKKLSNGLKHIRVDFYEANGKVYFGELTFYHFSGLVNFEPDEWDKKLGDNIDLSNIK